MTRPYDGAVPAQVWAHGITELCHLDPQAPANLRITKEAKIASAGSCFAGRIARELSSRGFNYLKVEDGSEFSARYGNVYSAAALRQLAEMAMGVFHPAEVAWEHNGLYYDPYRVRAAGAFESVDAVCDSRAAHLAAVREVLTQADIFIFTLGLTESWVSRLDGAVFSQPPGYGAGQYDPNTHAFKNANVDSVVADIEAFATIAHSLNPNLRTILTVSPVPLAMTAEPRHVLASTVYSKSVLRVAAQMLVDRHSDFEYFASYEIVTAMGFGSDYYEADHRTVSDRAVDHVMRSFFANFIEEDFTLTIDAGKVSPHEDPCDEEHLLRAAMKNTRFHES